MISSAAMPATGQPRMTRGQSPQASVVYSPTASSRRQIAGTSSIRIQCSWMFCRSVMSAVSRAYAAEMSAMTRSCSLVSAPPSMRTRSMKYSSSSSSGSRTRRPAAVDAGPALGVEPPPAHPAAQVGRVDRVEAPVGVDVLDPGPDVEPVVVLLDLLVGVERLAVAHRPLPGPGGAAPPGGRVGSVSLGGGGGGRGAGGNRGRPRAGAARGGGDIMLRVRPRSTWRRPTRNGRTWVTGVRVGDRARRVDHRPLCEISVHRSDFCASSPAWATLAR